MTRKSKLVFKRAGDRARDARRGPSYYLPARVTEPLPTLRVLIDVARTSSVATLVTRLGAFALVGPAAAPTATSGQFRYATEFTKRGPDAPDPMADFLDNIAIGLLKRPGTAFASVLVVGRAPTSDVWIDDVSVSKLHARITIEEDGAHVISDARSTNGTWVNDAQIDEREARLLVEGTRLRFGDRGFTVRSTPTLHQMLSRFTPR